MQAIADRPIGGRSQLRCRHPSKHNGFSLLELVVASVLMAFLLTSLVLSLAQQRRTLKMAEQRQDAAALADELLAGWWDTPNGVPAQSRGLLGSQQEWLWRTQVVGTRELFGRPCMLVRLDIFRRDLGMATAVASVETLKPVE